MSHEIVCGSRKISYLAFLDPSGAFLQAIHHQLRFLHLDTQFVTFEELTGNISTYLTTNELYDKFPARHGSQILRILVRYLKVAFEIFYVNGYRQIFPYLYRNNKPAIQLLSLNTGYGSVLHLLDSASGISATVFPPIRVATWNVQGARLQIRRKLIDKICITHDIDVLCLQDARFYDDNYATEHYDWIPSSASSTACPKQGCFILLRKKTGFQFHQLEIGLPAEECFVVAVIRRESQFFVVISAYLPCNGQPEAFPSYDLLDIILTKMREKHPTLPLLVCGDFNAHLGEELYDCRGEMTGLIGPNLLHTETNENGELLAGITHVHRLGTVSTMFSSSTIVTRTHGNTQSQLDHILIYENLVQHVLSLYGEWQPLSDHKLIVMDLSPPSPDTCTLEFGLLPMPSRRPFYDLSTLGLPKHAKAFDAAIAAAVAQSSILNPLTTTIHNWQEVPLNRCSEALTAIVKTVAEKQLKSTFEIKKKVKRLQERRELFTKVHANHRVRRIDSLRGYNQLSDYPTQRRQLVQDLVAATRAYERARKEKERVEAEEVLRKMSKTSHINVRLDICFKFLKARRRSNAAPCPQVTLQSLEHELSQLDHGPIAAVPLIDHIIMPSPPSLPAFGAALLAAKTGVSPGLDCIHPEFYHASATLNKLTSKIMHAAFIQMRSPQEWNRTTITLIPKIPKPLGYSDFRPITLSPCAYKAFARVLLERIQEHVGPIRAYQSGFLVNRSCDDQHFTQQRILETEWNHKRAVYMLSLDFKQAFNSVNLHKLAEVLKVKGVPCYLINIIVNICLSEETSINWVGVETSVHRKTVGVKQGCTIAPYLFILTLDVVLDQAQRHLSTNDQIELYLGEDRPIQLPTLFAYADDLNIFSHTLGSLDTIMARFIPIMHEYGLEFNPSKCHLVRKSPVCLTATAQSPTVCLGGLTIPIQKSMTVLGSSYGEDMNRRQMIINRCTKAIRLFYAMRKHLLKCELNFDILVRLYKVVIAPVLLFGLRSVSITKGNQIILLRRELHILKSLAQLASPPARNEEVFKVLRGRTINRRLIVSRLVYYGHVQRKAASSALQKALNYQLYTKRKVGRPLFTYSNTILNELASLSEVIDDEEWISALNDREKLKTLCEQIYEHSDYHGDPMPPTTRLYDAVFAQSAR